MKLEIDTESQTLTVKNAGASTTLPLYSDAAFEHLSQLWVKVGWNQKYSYTFTWLGRPIIQLPEDLVRIQEVLHRVKPDLIVETGVAHGGSLILYASLCEAMHHGRVLGIDIEIRPHNRAAIESHPLSHRIALVEGSSTDPQTLQRVQQQIRPGERVLVLLDSNHSRAHVLAELEAYAPLVAVDSYLVATDGIMQDLSDVPRGQPEWQHDNPVSAVQDFLKRHPEFALEEPAWPFNESGLKQRITHWPHAYLRRRAP